MSAALAIIEPGAVAVFDTAADWAGAIGAAWRRSAAAMIETGRLIVAAKAALPHGEFTAMVETALPFGERKAQMLMRIATDERLANPIHGSVLPPSYRALYELTKLDDNQFAAGIERGVIRPDMERKHVKLLTASGHAAPAREDEQTGTAEDLAAIAERGVKFGNIYADPPWPYSNQATRASTDNHYDGMSVDDICALPIAALAAETAHLHLWTTNGFLPEAFRVIEAWGFTYKSCLVWVKPQMGIGNYWRVSHEFLLLGTRGQRVFSEHSHMSWLQAERGRHSAKAMPRLWPLSSSVPAPDRAGDHISGNPGQGSPSLPDRRRVDRFGRPQQRPLYICLLGSLFPEIPSERVVDTARAA